MITQFAPPEETFVIGVPTSVFAESNMNRFADPDTNYPTKVLAKALSLEARQGNIISESWLDRDVRANEWVRFALTPRTMFAVLAAFEKYWKATFFARGGRKWDWLNDCKNWLGQVIADIDNSWVKSRVSREVRACRGDLDLKHFQRLYEAKLPDGYAQRIMQKKPNTDCPLKSDSQISLILNLGPKTRWDGQDIDGADSESQFEGYMPIPIALSDGSFPLERFAPQCEVPVSVFAEDNMKQFGDEVNYPTKVLAKALTLQLLRDNGNTMVRHGFDLTYDLHSEFTPDQLLAHYLTLHTSISALASLKTWWESKRGSDAGSELKEAASNWFAGSMQAVNLDWIKHRLKKSATRDIRARLDYFCCFWDEPFGTESQPVIPAESYSQDLLTAKAAKILANK